MSSAPVGQVHEQRVSRSWVDEEGIIRGVAKAGADYGLEDATDGFRAHRALSGSDTGAGQGRIRLLEVGPNR